MVNSPLTPETDSVWPVELHLKADTRGMGVTLLLYFANLKTEHRISNFQEKIKQQEFLYFS